MLICPNYYKEFCNDLLEGKTNKQFFLENVTNLTPFKVRSKAEI